MARIQKDVYVTSSPQATWALVGDVDGVAGWVPGVDSCDLSGDVRTVNTAVGSFRERIISHDNTAMRYEYVLEDAPFEVVSHLGTIQVEESGSGSHITYTVDIEPAELATALEPGLEAALSNVKAQLDSAAV